MSTIPHGGLRFLSVNGDVTISAIFRHPFVRLDSSRTVFHFLVSVSLLIPSKVAQSVSPPSEDPPFAPAPLRSNIPLSPDEMAWRSRDSYSARACDVR